jgi:hypothetical protein
MTRIFVVAVAAALAFPSLAQAAKSSVICPPPKVKANAGVGNGAEGGRTEKRDIDPGNSGANNQAGKNSFKPNSAASAGMP